MKKIVGLVILLSLFGCGASEKKVEKVTVEFRLAETQPGGGLTAMTIARLGQTFYVHEEVLISNADIAWAMPTTWLRMPVVELTFTETGREKFAQVTKDNLGKPMGIVVDGELVIVIIIQAPIVDGKTIVDGKFSEEEAKRIATGIISK
jgi:preprotein translocase subunit SecD